MKKYTMHFSDLVYLIGSTLIIHSAKLKGSDFQDVATVQVETRKYYLKNVAFRWK